jgi:hypothetical protein
MKLGHWGVGHEKGLVGPQPLPLMLPDCKCGEQLLLPHAPTIVQCLDTSPK